MAAVEAAEEEIAELLSSDDVTIAAVNGPAAVVVSGTEEGVERVMAAVRERGRRVTRLRVSHAFHSPLMEPMLDEFTTIAEQIDYRHPALHSTSAPSRGARARRRRLDDRRLLGAASPPAGALPRRRHATASPGTGAVRLLEIGPDPVLSGLVEAAAERTAVSALRKGRPEAETLLSAVAELFVRGADVDWAAVLAGTGAHNIPLPTYAFQRQRYWLRPAAPVPPRTASVSGPRASAARRGAARRRFGHPAAHLATLRRQPPLAGRARGCRTRRRPRHGAARTGGPGRCPGGPRPRRRPHPARATRPPRGRRRTAADLRRTAGRPRTRALRVTPAPRAPPPTPPGPCTPPPPRPHRNPSPAGICAPGRRPAPNLSTPDGLYERLAAAGLDYGTHLPRPDPRLAPGDDLYVEAALPEPAATEATGFGCTPRCWTPSCTRSPCAARTTARPCCRSSGRVCPSRRPAPRPCARTSSRPVTARSPCVSPTPSARPSPSCGRWYCARCPPPSCGPRRAGIDHLYRLDWTPAAQAPDIDELDHGQRRALVSSDARAERSWAAAGVPVTRYRDVDALLTALDAGTEVPDAVILPVPGGEPDGTRPSWGVPANSGEVLRAITDFLGAMRTWLADERLTGTRLVVTTSDAVPAGPAPRSGGDPDLSGAGVWGLVRSAKSEHPGRLPLADLDGDPASYRASRRSPLPRRGTSTSPPRGPIWLPTPDDDGLRRSAGAAGRGRGDVVAHGGRAAGPPGRRGARSPRSRASLGAGEVRVAVRAAGVNFRDVLNVLGMYPGDAGRLGMRVRVWSSRWAPDVSGLAVGDRVMGLLDGAFAPSAVTDARMLARVPEGWSFEQAASVPIVFLTAYYALVDLAGLKAGESVLMHAAAGGVGMAAVQLARHLGAEVFATASEPKWPVVRELGVPEERIASSRTTGVRGAVPRPGRVSMWCWTRSAGEFVDASLRLVRPRWPVRRDGQDRHPGRRTRSPRPTRVGYQAFDLFDAGPDRIAGDVGGAAGAVRAGCAAAAERDVVGLARAAEALRLLSQAKHVGKVVLTVPSPWSGEGTVLITGGTGGLGADVARHLVTAHGVRDLLLVTPARARGSGRRRTPARSSSELGAEVTCRGVRRDRP